MCDLSVLERKYFLLKNEAICTTMEEIFLYFTIIVGINYMSLITKLVTINNFNI